MIFVTVGTHEQSFDRLLIKIDQLCALSQIEEEVIIQTGYSSYEPKNCRWFQFISYSEMKSYMEEARIVITHGGPASFVMALQERKVPIVVPRSSQFNEHINDHQVEFVKQVSERCGNIIPIYDIDVLGKKIATYEEEVNKMDRSLRSNNNHFNNNIDKIVNEMFFI